MLRSFVEAVAQDPAVSELLVVLDGDVDGSADALESLRHEFPVVRPVRTEHRGHLGALQLGIESASADVVLLMDDDVVAGPSLGAGHARRHAQDDEPGDGLVVMGYMPVDLSDEASPATRLYAAEYEKHCRRLESGQLEVLRGLWLGNVSARRADLLRVGLESDHFAAFWHSDLDLGLRLEESGLHGVFDRTLVASHKHARDAEAFLRDARARGHSASLLERQYPDRFDAAHTVPMLDDLGPGVRQTVSFLGQGRRAAPVGRLLMAAGSAAERVGWSGGSIGAAKLARRVELVAGYRGTGA